MLCIFIPPFPLFQARHNKIVWVPPVSLAYNHLLCLDRGKTRFIVGLLLCIGSPVLQILFNPSKRNADLFRMWFFCCGDVSAVVSWNFSVMISYYEDLLYSICRRYVQYLSQLFQMWSLLLNILSLLNQKNCPLFTYSRSHFVSCRFLSLLLCGFGGLLWKIFPLLYVHVEEFTVCSNRTHFIQFDILYCVVLLCLLKDIFSLVLVPVICCSGFNLSCIFKVSDYFYLTVQ